MLDGSFGRGSVTASGTGNVYLVGSVSGLMQVDASGITSIFIESTPCRQTFHCISLPLIVQYSLSIQVYNCRILTKSQDMLYTHATYCKICCTCMPCLVW